jgi:hypothetical protein
VSQALEAASLKRIDLKATGVGQIPSRQGATPQEQEQNRRASFRVRLPDSSSRNNPQ